jgi:hypothetical protein
MLFFELLNISYELLLFENPLLGSNEFFDYQVISQSKDNFSRHDCWARAHHFPNRPICIQITQKTRVQPKFFSAFHLASPLS